MLIFKYVFCLFQFTLKVIFLDMCFPWSRLFRDFKKFKIFLKVKWSLRTIEWRNLMTIFDICLTIPNIKPCKIISSQNREITYPKGIYHFLVFIAFWLCGVFFRLLFSHNLCFSFRHFEFKKISNKLKSYVTGQNLF